MNYDSKEEQRVKKKLLSLFLALALCLIILPTVVFAGNPEPQAAVTVTFEPSPGKLNSGISGTVQVSPNMVIPESSAPNGSNMTGVKNKWAFEGWYKDVDYTQKWDFDTPVTEDMTLYAHWVEGYTVAYNANGGTFTGALASRYVPVGSPIPWWFYPDDSAYTYPGYELIGWFKDKACTDAWDFEKDTMPDTYLILYAGWKELDEAYFVDNGVQTKADLNDDGTVVRPADPTREGYVFQGWYTDETFATPFDFENTVVDNGLMMIYAKWQRMQTWADFNTVRPEGFVVDDAAGTISISSPDGLGYLASVVNGTAMDRPAATLAAGETLEGYKVILTQDIDLSGKEWTPIGSTTYDAAEECCFQGVFDGDGHTISGLTLTDGALPYIGLFGRTAEAEIRDLTVTGLIEIEQDIPNDTNTLQYVGGVCGLNTNAILENVVSDVRIKVTAEDRAYSGSHLNVGGIVGRNHSGTVKSCVNLNDITVTAKSSNMSQQFNIGGITGVNGRTRSTIVEINYGTSIVDGCVNKGAVTAENIGTPWVGGVAGANYVLGTTKIYNCANYGTVSSNTTAAGGVAGVNRQATVINCYSFGAVSNQAPYTAYSGGLGGQNTNGGVFQNSYSAGAVSGNSSGGVVGNNYGTTSIVYGCFWRETSAVSSTGKNTGSVDSCDSFAQSGIDDEWYLTSDATSLLLDKLNGIPTNYDTYCFWIRNQENLPIFGGPITLEITRNDAPYQVERVELTNSATGYKYTLAAAGTPGQYTAEALYVNGQYQAAVKPETIPCGDYTLEVDGKTVSLTVTGPGTYTVKADDPVTPPPDTEPDTPSAGESGDPDYTLRYNTNGGEAIRSESRSYSWMKKYEDLPVPVRNGYIFDGWYLDSRLTVPVENDVKVNRSTITLYAGWSKHMGTPDSNGISGWLNTRDHNAYLNGYGNGTFGPDNNMTRAQVAQMFYNLLLNKDVPATVTFSDVPADAWYATAVNTLASLGIVNGIGNGQFAPDQFITRAQFTVIAMRFTNGMTGTTNGENIFSDVNTSDWFYDQVVGSIQYGWITGYSDGTFQPNKTISRAEVTTIVNRMLGRSADEDYVDRHEADLHLFLDVNKDYWAYYQIVEATNAHNYEKNGNTENWTKLG